MITITKKINWDALGIATSIACAIHCALLPLILTSLPLFGVNIINNLSFEFFMILLAFCIGAYSLYHGWKKHHHRSCRSLFFVVGCFLLFSKQIWRPHELFLLIPAVIFIVSAHYLNLRFCRSHNHAHQDDCNH